MNFCDLTLDACTHMNIEYDYVLIVRWKSKGYFIAFPCQRTLTSEDLAGIFLEKVVTFAGLPRTIVTDHDHLINAKFFSTLCS